jgi:thiol:disulfide interchange protein
LLAVLATTLIPLPALARETFSDDAFKSATAAGKPVLVEFHADWCPTCRAQDKVINSFRHNPEYKGLVILRVDFDAEKELLKRFGVRRQSTLIVFKGDGEVARAVGESSPDGIKKLLNKAF